MELLELYFYRNSNFISKTLLICYSERILIKNEKIYEDVDDDASSFEYFSYKILKKFKKNDTFNEKIKFDSL